MTQSVITLRGPTASGKTDLAIDLSNKLPLEIISVDSVMVYRGLNIGSAKPDQKTLEDYPHHLIDICDPSFNYSLGDFYEDVNNAIKDNNIQSIIHLAALQVPFCAADPIKGAKVNVVGTVNIFEAVRKYQIKHLVYRK